MTGGLAWLGLGLCAIVAGGGYFQVWKSAIFWCGRVEAFPQTAILALIGLVQTALYLGSAASPRWTRVYRRSQVTVLAFVAIGLVQVFAPHPRTVILFATLGAVPVTLSLARPRWRWMRPDLPVICGLFVVSALTILAALGQIPLTLPGVVMPRWYVGVVAVGAAAASIPVIGSIRADLPATTLRLPDPARYLPLALLLFAVLRAKFPDVAYDSTLYKTTLPYQLAEWRTGDTAIIDQFMVGTNLQEMLNALLVVLGRDYLPPFISTISCILLLLITPLAFRIEQQASPPGRAVVAFAGASAFVVSEAGIAQGTSHHEPLLLLFLVAALIRSPVWPGFLAAAIAVKVNALFIAPLVLLYHVLQDPPFLRSPRSWLIGAVTAAAVLVPQINRNVIFSGRVLGMNETLAAMTDPPGPHRIMAAGQTRYDEKVRGGVVNNAGLAACNMWLLTALCPTQYQGSDSAGFHVFPASRAVLYAVVFGLLVLLGGGAVPTRRMAGFASVGVFFACLAGLLAFLSEARYFLPLSFGFSVLLLMNPERAEAIVRSLGPGAKGRYLAAGLGCWCIGGDLVPGTFTNVSWICRRELLTPAHTVDLRQPETPTQRFLAAYVGRYQQHCPPPGLPPVILAEHDVLNSPYLGTQRIFYLGTQQMIARFFAADPARQARAGEAIIAVVSQHPGYAGGMLGAATKDYTPCFDDGTLHVVCSRLLAPAGRDCATSLYWP